MTAADVLSTSGFWSYYTMPKRKLQRNPALRHDKRMNEYCFLLNYYTAGKTAGLASGCVFCSVRASMIRHSRKLALRLKHFARWRKLARTSLRKPHHCRLSCSFVCIGMTSGIIFYFFTCLRLRAAGFLYLHSPENSL